MPTVNIAIGKRDYTLVCGDGQEESLHLLAADITQRIDAMAQSMDGASDTFLLVMAALTMQDEINNSKGSDGDNIPAQSTTSQEDIEKHADMAVTDAINAISEYIENVADRIETK